jgi:HPt (histidine-containing phosphotransfer) domain-containing protein
VDEPPVLDRERLTLITRGNTTLAEEFLRALIAECAELFERLEAPLRSADRVAVSDIGHTLKGIAAELGAMRLRAAAAALETETQIAAWPQQVERLHAALAELRSQASTKP